MASMARLFPPFNFRARTTRVSSFMHEHKENRWVGRKSSFLFLLKKNPFLMPILWTPAFKQMHGIRFEWNKCHTVATLATSVTNLQCTQRWLKRTRCRMFWHAIGLRRENTFDLPSFDFECALTAWAYLLWHLIIGFVVVSISICVFASCNGVEAAVWLAGECGSGRQCAFVWK